LDDRDAIGKAWSAGGASIMKESEDLARFLKREGRVEVARIGQPLKLNQRNIRPKGQAALSRSKFQASGFAGGH
jgi:hypothetical protein